MQRQLKSKQHEDQEVETTGTVEPVEHIEAELLPPDEISQEMSIVVPDALVMPALGHIDGEITFSDFEMPYIKIVQGIGASSLKYNEGTIVFNGSEIAAPPPKPGEYSAPLLFTPLKGKKVYREKLPWDDKNQKMGRIANTQQEIQNMVDEKGERIAYAEELRLVMLIRANNEETKAKFSLEGPDGNRYAMGMWFISGVSYGCGRALIAACSTTLAKCIFGWEWKLQVRKEPYGKGICYVPKIGLSTEHSKDTINWIRKTIQ